MAFWCFVDTKVWVVVVRELLASSAKTTLGDEAALPPPYNSSTEALATLYLNKLKLTKLNNLN